MDSIHPEVSASAAGMLEIPAPSDLGLLRSEPEERPPVLLTGSAHPLLAEAIRRSHTGESVRELGR